MNQISAVQTKAIQVGFWSSLLTAFFSVVFTVSTLVFLPPDWKGIQSYASSFNSLQMISVIPPIVFALTNIILMVSLHYHVSEDKRMFSSLGIAFAIIYATIICTNAYLQLFVVRLNILQGQLEGLSLLAMPNLRSVFFALEAVGYGFLSVAMLATSPVFKGGRLANWIRVLFIVIGVIGVYGAIIALLDNPVLILAGLGIWELLFPISMILVCIYFKNAGQQTGSIRKPAQQQLAR